MAPCDLQRAQQPKRGFDSTRNKKSSEKNLQGSLNANAAVKDVLCGQIRSPKDDKAIQVAADVFSELLICSVAGFCAWYEMHKNAEAKRESEIYHFKEEIRELQRDLEQSKSTQKLLESQL